MGKFYYFLFPRKKSWCTSCVYHILPPSFPTVSGIFFVRADVIALSVDMSGIERTLISPGVGFLNAYSGAIAYVEVLSGLRQRIITPPNIRNPVPIVVDTSSDSEEVVNSIAAKSSIILALSPERDCESENINAIATVELRLQMPDGKIPFSEPFFDKIERKIGEIIGLGIKSPKKQTLQPYLSNLCVIEGARGRKFGKALVRCVEKIAAEEWGYSKIYLHVDLDNIPALNLYRSEGYKDVGFRWDPWWAGKASEIGYFEKNI